MLYLVTVETDRLNAIGAGAAGDHHAAGTELATIQVATLRHTVVAGTAASWYTSMIRHGE